MTLSRRHPWLRPAAVLVHRTRRRVAWLTSGTDWASDHSSRDLPVRAYRHGSLLLRELGGAEMQLQHNKVVNLRLASARVDRLVIRPGETFSFNKVVGSCTRRKGYIEGMRLSDGAAVPGVGGGICQLANLLHWMFLHSPLTVVERSEHSFDPFPDNGRVLPWGVGCSIAYNYVDLVVRNDTSTTFQLRAWVGERHLRGELRADRELPVSYSVEARNERFELAEDGQVRRSNEIWRTSFDRRTGAPVADELVKRNRAVVKYPVDAAARQATTRPRSTTADGRSSTERSSSGLTS
jgi:vancomycin resistance protein VanW